MTIPVEPLRRNIYSIALLCILFVFIAMPYVFYPDLNHGDEFADANILTAGRNFAKFGFIKCRFLEFTDEQIDDPGSAAAYTHYPPLNDILNGVWRIVFRTDSLLFFRVIALLFSLAGVIFWFFFIKKLTNSYVLSWLTAVFYMTNPVFIYGMDALHQCSYAETVRMMLLYFFAAAYVDAGPKRKIIVPVIWSLFFIESLLTFEYIIYFVLFFILFKYLFKARNSFPSWKVIFSFVCAPVCAFVLHVFQNVWYFGSFSRAFQDLQGAAVRRIAYSTDAPAMSFYAWWNYVIVRNFSLVFSFNYLLLFIAGFLSYLLYHRLSAESKRKALPLLRLSVILAMCGVSWYIAFPSHSWAHAFVGFLVRHLVPVASLGFAVFCFIVIRYIRENLKHPRYAAIILGFIIGIIIITGIGNSQLPVTPDRIKDAQEFVKFKECLFRLRQISRPGDTIGVNYFRSPFIRYYTERDFILAFDRSALDAAPRYPRYFVFMPYSNQNTKELFEYLQQNYTPLWQCNSLRFPAIFFELKK
jgi:hypothetical protein